RAMRDEIIETDGRSGEIVRHRLIQALPYFVTADAQWTQAHLISPLISGKSENIALWHAVAIGTRFKNVLKIMGNEFTERAVDLRLSRETRTSLAFSVIVECLHAFNESRDPVIPIPRVQQMIRALDDEVRAYGADAVSHFLRDVSLRKSRSEDQTHTGPAPDQLFRSAVVPFLRQVWPQERSLATPGVSRALADLPALSEGAFAEAVEAVAPFLVPFDCWSMIDYGLYGEEDGRAKLELIDSPLKAAAFLRLLSLTIGTAEDAVVPHDLPDALDQIRKVLPACTNDQSFRRLSTATRRF
ncbi:MAG: hypothetical protein JWM77_416, partial [Rhodospirillales bacterium]|nr:hypothetical protein [Rhodospirillales bacterium]